MPKAKQSSTALTNDGATVGYETRLWQMADALRGSMDAAEYKHVVLGLIFLKYISARERPRTAPCPVDTQGQYVPNNFVVTGWATYIWSQR